MENNPNIIREGASLQDGAKNPNEAEPIVQPGAPLQDAAEKSD